jgi:hypothetical protein
MLVTRPLVCRSRRTRPEPGELWPGELQVRNIDGWSDSVIEYISVLEQTKWVD